MLVVNKLETIIAIARMKTGTFGTAFTNRWRRSTSRTPTRTKPSVAPAVPVPSPPSRCRFARDGQGVTPIRDMRRYVSDYPRRFDTNHLGNRNSTLGGLMACQLLRRSCIAGRGIAQADLCAQRLQ